MADKNYKKLKLLKVLSIDNGVYNKNHRFTTFQLLSRYEESKITLILTKLLYTSKFIYIKYFVLSQLSHDINTIDDQTIELFSTQFQNFIYTRQYYVDYEGVNVIFALASILSHQNKFVDLLSLAQPDIFETHNNSLILSWCECLSNLKKDGVNITESISPSFVLIDMFDDFDGSVLQHNASPHLVEMVRQQSLSLILREKSRNIDLFFHPQHMSYLDQLIDEECCRLIQEYGDSKYTCIIKEKINLPSQGSTVRLPPGTLIVHPVLQSKWKENLINGSYNGIPTCLNLLKVEKFINAETTNQLNLQNHTFTVYDFKETNLTPFRFYSSAFNNRKIFSLPLLYWIEKYVLSKFSHCDVTFLRRYLWTDIYNNKFLNIGVFRTLLMNFMNEILLTLLIGKLDVIDQRYFTKSMLTRHLFFNEKHEQVEKDLILDNVRNTYRNDRWTRRFWSTYKHIYEYENNHIPPIVNAAFCIATHRFPILKNLPHSNVTFSPTLKYTIKLLYMFNMNIVTPTLIPNDYLNIMFRTSCSPNFKRVIFHSIVTANPIKEPEEIKDSKNVQFDVHGNFIWNYEYVRDAFIIYMDRKTNFIHELEQTTSDLRKRNFLNNNEVTIHFLNEPAIGKGVYKEVMELLWAYVKVNKYFVQSEDKTGWEMSGSVKQNHDVNCTLYMLGFIWGLCLNNYMYIPPLSNDQWRVILSNLHTFSEMDLVIYDYDRNMKYMSTMKNRFEFLLFSSRNMTHEDVINSFFDDESDAEKKHQLFTKTTQEIIGEFYLPPISSMFLFVSGFRAMWGKMRQFPLLKDMNSIFCRNDETVVSYYGFVKSVIVDHPYTHKYFLPWVKSLNQNLLVHLIHFITGSRNLPLYDSTNERIHICWAADTTYKLPVATNCTNHLTIFYMEDKPIVMHKLFKYIMENDIAFGKE